MTATQEFSVVIPGAPVPKARPRFCVGRVVTPRRTREYEKHVASCAGWQMLASKTKTFHGPVELTVRFFEADRRPRDTDNLLKGIMDGLTRGRVWEDDRQVVSIEAKREVDRNSPRVEITVRPIQEHRNAP